ncbi:hypothetical protein Tco_1189295 [Tanacetum coccineum]
MDLLVVLEALQVMEDQRGLAVQVDLEQSMGILTPVYPIILVNFNFVFSLIDDLAMESNLAKEIDILITEVAYMMVDSIASARFKILRPKPVGFISDGDVRGDSVTVTKNNTTKRSGDIITVSGKGRLKVEEVDETKTEKCAEEINTISMIYEIKIGRFKLSEKKLAYCLYRTIIRYGTMVGLKFKCATTGFLRKQPCLQRGAS